MRYYRVILPLLVVFLAVTVGEAATIQVQGSCKLEFQDTHDAILVEFLPGPPPAAAAQTYTDINGDFTLPVQSPGGYNVRFSKPGYFPDTMPSLFLYVDTMLSNALLTKEEFSIGGGTTTTLQLDRTHSPYRIDQDVFCDSLYIEAGSRLRFYGQANITVQKHIDAQGHLDDSIYFSWPGASGLDPGLKFLGQSANFIFCRIDSVVTWSTPISDWTPLRLSGNGNVLISDCRIMAPGFKPRPYPLTNVELGPGLRADGSVHLTIQNSFVDQMRIDSTAYCDIENSHVLFRDERPTILRGAVSNAYLEKPFSRLLKNA